MEKKIRRAIKEDIPRVLELLVQVDMVHHIGRPDIFKGPATKYNAEELEEIVSDNSTPVFVCTGTDGTIMGHAFCVHKQVIGDSVLTDIKTLYIDDICVDEAYRGNGVGRALYEHVKEYAKEKGFHRIELNMWEFNKGALAFYESVGFETYRRYVERIRPANERPSRSSEEEEKRT